MTPLHFSCLNNINVPKMRSNKNINIFEAMLLKNNADLAGQQMHPHKKLQSKQSSIDPNF